MEKTIILEFSYDDFITHYGKKVCSYTEPEPDEFFWHCPRELGCGTFQRVKIRPGFDLWLTDCSFCRDIIFKNYEIPVTLQFNFTLSGHYRVRFNDNPDYNRYFGEFHGISYYNSAYSYCRLVHDVPSRSVSLTLQPNVFLNFYKRHLHLIPPMIHDMIQGKVNAGYLYQSTITPAIREVIHQIIGCRFHGIARKLFLESKALELLSLQLDQICTTPLSSPSCMRIHRHDKKRVEGVRDLLDGNLETPPSLQQLAKAAGMSHPKLNRCFKEMYGMTVFQYLRTERLNRAKIMLQEEGYSVTETAFQVGYDSVSHFSQVYKKQFGASPSASVRFMTEG
nr:AraC family transcriptional regulator [uncultured Desulfobacter sp.]